MKPPKEKKTPPHTFSLMIKAFKEVVAADPFIGITYAVFMNLLSVTVIVEIRIMGKFIDSIANFIKNYSAFDIQTFLRSDVFTIFILLIGIYLLRTFFEQFNAYFDARLSDFFWNNAYAKGMRKVSSLNLEDIEKNEVQTLLSEVPAYSISATWDTYLKTMQLGYQLIRLIAISYIIATQMAWWGIVVMVLVIPEVYIRNKYNQKIKKYRDLNAEKPKYYNYLYHQSRSLPNFPELRVDNIFEFFNKSYKEVSEKYLLGQNKLRKKQSQRAFLFGWFDGSIRKVVQLALIPIAVIRKYTIGTFKYLFDYIDNLYDASWYVFWNISMIRYNALYVKDYFDFAEYKGFGDVVSGTEKLDAGKTPKIEFRNVSFHYPETETPILDNISIEIEPGEKVAIIGRDNSGKSTIAKLLCGLYQIGPGDILIDNISIKNLARGELKRKISVVFENYVKYSFSFKKNIVLTQPDCDFNRHLYEQALEITDLDKWMKEEKINDNQVLGKLFAGGRDISTGHWQRVALARAIYRDRQILILDESLTQIDGFSRRPILEKIIKHRPKQTLINITQDDTEKDIFDKLIYIDKGKIAKVEVCKVKEKILVHASQ